MKNKHLKRTLWLILLIISQETFAQDVELFSIAPFPLEITFNKTVNLIFAYPIKSVDKGSSDILARKPKGLENILQLKAAKKDFQQTNLTVITSDGKLYSFIVDYRDEPSQLSIELIKNNANMHGPGAQLSSGENEQKLETLSRQAADSPKNMRRIHKTSHQVRFSLSGLSVKDDVIFYRLKLQNKSAISYDIESLRFFIADKKHVKRSASQQTEIIPLYVHGNIVTVSPQVTAELVFTLPKFTVSDQKVLNIQLMEKNGGRHMELKIQNKIIIKAAPVD